MLAVACGGPGGASVSYRLLSEGQEGAFCIEAPRTLVTSDRQEWDAALAESMACIPDGRTVSFEVDFDAEVAAAAWWRVAPCLGWDVETTAVRKEGAAVVVEAKTAEPSGMCAQALGMLQSFYAFDRQSLAGVSEVRFVLDGELVGTKGI